MAFKVPKTPREHPVVDQSGKVTTPYGSMLDAVSDRLRNGPIDLVTRSTNPDKPLEGESIMWASDGTGLGDDGDVIIASTIGGVTKYAILFDYSAGSVW